MTNRDDASKKVLLSGFSFQYNFFSIKFSALIKLRDFFYMSYNVCAVLSFPSSRVSAVLANKDGKLLHLI